MQKQSYKTTYAEKLRDPRWQKMRLKIMERDYFSCQRCCDENSTLNVHHCYYESGKEPWDYPPSSLVTLCEDCHSFETEFYNGVKSYFLTIISQKGLITEHVQSIANGIWSFDFTHKEVNCAVIQWMLENREIYEQIESMYFSSLRKEAKDGKD